MKDLKHGGVYKVNSRNLVVGVWDEPNKQFIGIRHKFGGTLIDTEDHRDTGPPHGTALGMELIEMLPEGIEIKENFGPYDSANGRFVVYKDNRYVYLDTQEPMEAGSGPVHVKGNKALREYLLPIDEKLREASRKEWEEHVRKVDEVRKRRDGAQG